MELSRTFQDDVCGVVHIAENRTRLITGCKRESVDFISISIGHSDIKTTQFELGDFNPVAQKEMTKALVDAETAFPLNPVLLPKYVKFNYANRGNSQLSGPGWTNLH